MAVTIKFLGASGTVTGSCYLVQYNNTQFLVDCGMFQGPDVEARNLLPFDFDPATIDFVLLTHTHIDHSGLLPKLVRGGFNGPIYSTLHTSQLASILLLDSAKIQESNFEKGIPWKHAKVVEMIYNNQDAQETIAQFTVVNFLEKVSLGDGITVTYVPAAHVLGAASLEIEIDGKLIVFSGDIGRLNHELLGGFDLNHRAEPDYIIMESLYGGQLHPTRSASLAEMMNLVKETIRHNGSVYIPCFAVQRTQEMLNDFKHAKESGAIDQDVNVWLDSPMAQKVTYLYDQALTHTEDSLFNFQGLHYTRNFRQSQKMSTKPRQIVIAGSGMADGGRIMGHLAANLSNPKNTVCFVGYQAEATVGRQLVEGATEVTINDRPIKVNAKIAQFEGFSAHGDNSDYLAWVKRYISPKLKNVFLVHAEADRAQAFKQSLSEINVNQVQIPEWHAEYTI